jgi:hypothetical protein
MPRPSLIDDLIFVKTPNTGNSLRDRIFALARDEERVGDLIERAVKAGIGNRRQVRAAIYLGPRTVGSKFRLMEGKK